MKPTILWVFILILNSIDIYANTNTNTNIYKILNSIAEPKAITTEDKKIISLIKKTVLDQGFNLKTDEKQFVHFLLNESYELSVFNNSEIKIQSIYTSEGLSSLSVEIVDGQVYIQKIKSVKSVSRLRLWSDFFEWNFDQNQAGLNMWIQLNSKKPSIKFCNRENNFEVLLFDHEKKINLAPLEAIIFEGKIENKAADKKVAFDILLNGRKIPKGIWLEKTKCSFDEISELEKNILKAEQLEKYKLAQAIIKTRSEKNKKDSNFLCQNPYGQMNDCAWIKINSVNMTANVKCQRTRCNAEGKWSDLQLISIEKSKNCPKTYFVSKCDY